MNRMFWIALLICIAPLARAVGPTTAPATQAGHWDEMSDRVVFLTTALATVEASIDAVNAQIRNAGYRANVKTDEAKLYAKGNELMNRNGGIPMSIDWRQFYGRTAQRFFYHPKGGENIYINPHPISERPPQFDYIFKANNQAKQQALADASALGNQVDKLLRRRTELEEKQVALWMQIPFESEAYQGLAEKPIYRYELRATSDGPMAQQQLAAVGAGAHCMRTIDALMNATKANVSKDLGGSLHALQFDTAAAEKTLEKSLLAQSDLNVELTSQIEPLGQLFAAAKRTVALANNVVDASDLAREATSSSDEKSKAQYRAVLGNSLLEYASTVSAADHYLEQVAQSYKIVPDTSHELSELKFTPHFSELGAGPSSPTDVGIPKDARMFNGHHFKVFWEAIDWNEADQRCRDMGGYLAWPPNDNVTKFLERLKGENNEVWLGGYLGKDGWKWAKDDHPIKEDRLRVKAGDKCIALSPHGYLVGHTIKHDDPGIKVKDVPGYICEWDH